MAAVPPFYEDLGKSSRDIFNKGFGMCACVYSTCMLMYMYVSVCLFLSLLCVCVQCLKNRPTIGHFPDISTVCPDKVAFIAQIVCLVIRIAQ